MMHTSSMVMQQGKPALQMNQEKSAHFCEKKRRYGQIKKFYLLKTISTVFLFQMKRKYFVNVLISTVPHLPPHSLIIYVNFTLNY